MFGQDEANHGTARYRVDGAGLVHVPSEAVGFLISRGGFALAKTTAVVATEAQSAETDPNSLVRLHHDDAGGCSYAGRGYPSRPKRRRFGSGAGSADLIAHGFVPAPEGGLRREAGTVTADRAGKAAPGAKAQAALREARG